MSATSIARDQVVACNTLIEHAIVDICDGERLLRAGDGQDAAIRLCDASSLLRIAAHELDSEVGVS